MSKPSSIDAASPADDSRHAHDAQLVRRVGTGDQSALGELYDRWVRPLHALASNILHDPTEAEDVLHDVFLTLWRKSADFDTTRGHAFSWAATLTRNRAIDRLRSRSRRSELLNQAAPADLGYDESNPGADGTDSAGHLWLKEKSSAVRRALATLPGDQRDVLQLAYFGGLTQLEIAEKLSQPLGTVKARIRRGLLKLRDVLAPQL
ncbi:sigma-70 family RNA polymerase sigma factor [Rariglobus hedericola]|uniref:Sigma-70 family RNA polymerase sigma factor n=1 Tax=Rariglobus hedericola TaxID=2597822 RepID=A0A556QQ60_9BACT|nr:sigma-70 family RNA polymerase sigma factor [Rariglobus hedericola]TSJ78773.1 sigma-70 family RNA polymerase sigma factor [Rariglobus hedericola]